MNNFFYKKKKNKLFKFNKLIKKKLFFIKKCHQLK